MSKSPAPVPDAGNLTTFSCPPKPNLQSHWRFHGHQLNHARYDELGRLKTAVTDGSAAYPQWGLEWSYDRYGNRLNQTKTHGTAFQSYLTLDASTNRISDRTYDLSGNLLQDGYAYKYDAENRAVDYGAGGVTYAYDASGLRAKRTYGATTTIYIFSGSQVIAEYASGAAANAPTREYIYAGGLLASIESGTTKYYYPDHLSTRMTMVGGTTTQQGHYPFGENWYPTSTTEKWKFTSYERGDENGNDYAMFRSYISSYGRFQTPDPAGLSAVNPVNPQTWNRYAYVGGNPTNAVDPSGLRMNLACPMGYCGGGGGEPSCLSCGGGLSPQLGPGQILMDGNAVDASTADLALNTGTGSLGPTTTYISGEGFATPHLAAGSGGLSWSFSFVMHDVSQDREDAVTLSNDAMAEIFGLPKGSSVFGAGPLPPGMDGALQAAKQLAKGLPKASQGPKTIPGKWEPDPEDLLSRVYKVMKYFLDNWPPTPTIYIMVSPCVTQPWTLPEMCGDVSPQIPNRL